MSTQDTYAFGVPTDDPHEDGPPSGMFGGGPPDGMFGDGPPEGFDGFDFGDFPELPDDEYNPYDPRTVQDPFPIYRAMREKARVTKSLLPAPFWGGPEGEGVNDVYIVTSYRELAYVLETASLFTSYDKTGIQVPDAVAAELSHGYPITPTLYSIDPPEHTRRRQISQHALSRERVASYEAQMRVTANEIVDSFVADGKADLYKQYCTPLIQTAMLELIGMPRTDLSDITGVTESFQEVCIPGTTPLGQVEAARHVVAYQRYFENAIKERQATPRGDYMGALADARNGENCPITMAEMVWSVMEMIGAGYGNTAESLVNVVHELLVDPDRWATIKADRSLIGSAVEEALRLQGSVHWLTRTAAEEIELGGVTMPAGATVVCLFAAANRDPEAFPEPDRFDIRRGGSGPLGRHLATGHGVHYCVGGLWARAALRVAVETLLERLPNVRFVPEFEANYVAQAPMARVVAELPVVWGD